ncbi:MAG: FeoB-associated Cys-rich membrane protein [Clostridia bacterium]|nr:FeoB-associated Cys-rich membrane protein [Clostridia bacterium]
MDIGPIVVLAVIGVIFLSIIGKWIYNKATGKSSGCSGCSGNCSSCHSCHSKHKNQD